MEFPGITVEDSGRLDHRHSTTNRGSILPAERGTMVGKHGDDDGDAPTWRCGNTPNAFREPADYEFGPTGDMSGNDPCTRGEG